MSQDCFQLPNKIAGGYQVFPYNNPNQSYEISPGWQDDT